MRKITLLFAVLLSLAGVTQVKAETLTANFNSGLPEGWSTVGSVTNDDSRARSGKGLWTSAKSTTDNYVITEAVEGTFEFYARAYNKSYASTVVVYEYTGSGLGTQLYTTGSMYTSSTPSWSKYSFTINNGSQLAIVLNYAAIDDVTYTQMEVADGPALTIKDGSTKITSPHIFNFGLATAGTTHTFTLSNPGTATLEGLAVAETGNFGATLSATTIAAGGEATLTITMPASTGSSEITISSTTDGIDNFVINASGIVRDNNKVYLDFANGQIPDGWTSVAIGSYASSYGSEWAASEGYVSQSGSSSSYEWAFTSPKLTFSEGETILFETEKYSSSTWYNPSIKVEYSTDGSTWTTIGSAYTDDSYDTWTSRSAVIPTADAKYIRFSGWYVKLRNIYGGEIPNEPKMVVTQPASLDFGVITEATAKTFTIANTGLATLEGISVTSSNSSIFAVTGAPTSLAAGASAEVTITMSAANTGAQSSEITVSATGMEDVKFTVTGVVLPDGLSKEEFTDGLPANWTNASWTFANGEATGKSSSAYLTTPKLVISEDDLIAIKAKRTDSDATDYITVQGSNDNGATWTAYTKKISGSEGLTYPDYATLVISDIPTTVNKIRFVGYYVVVDEIAGLTYAPVLSVTKDAAAVETPAAYDFGETAADATVTYNFANTGAGTINITNVAITGDGAAAYSTNWTESVAAPFDLTITRTYNAERAGAAQEAVVTVTTSEGDFVINVTGTDKAANAPELAVSSNALDFGKVTADAKETVTVTNNGTGSMTVNIASDSEDFVVSAAELTEIGAGESKTFDVTFKYGTPYGVKNGNITVTPTYEANAAQTITVTGKAKDPNVWSEDFAAGELPTGWDAGANWSIAEGVAKGSWTSSANYLTTAPLTVSATTDELTFDYVTTGGNVSIAIQMSKDGGDWTTCAATPAIPTYMSNGTSGTATITGLEAGSYQFRFKNDDYNLDNFEGFKLNLPDHMASITAYTIPESSNWTVTMKEGQSFDATVTVKEQRGVAEELTAKLYMGDDVIGTATGSVEAKGTKVLTITATPNVAAAEGAQMHIEVEWAGATMKTEEVTRYVAAITYLTLDETSSDAVVAGTYDNVTLKRQFAEGWNTVCLPFTVNDVEAFFGTNAKAYEFSGYNDNGNLSFNKVTTLTACYPYIVYVPAAITEDIELKDITIDASAWYTRKTNSSNAAVYFRGTYAPVAAGAWTKNADTDVIYGLNGNKLQKAGAAASIKGFRAYFDVPAAAEGRLAISFDGETTGIATIKADGSLEIEGAYNLNGQRVAAPQKGLYIVNGKKVVIK